MTTRLRAVSIGKVAHKKLNQTERLNGVVHSIFDRVLNVNFESIGLVSIGKPEIPMSMLHVRVDNPLINFNSPVIGAGKNVWATRKELIIGSNLIIDYSGSKIYKSPFERTNLKAAASSEILLTIKEIINAALFYPIPQEGLVPLLPHLLELCTRNDTQPELPIIASKAYIYIRQLVCALQKNDYFKGTEAAVNLIGLGPGLTPSSDDFLSGFMVGHINYYRLQSMTTSFARIVFPLLAAKSIALTNTISSQQIIWAANGHSHEILEKMCLYILTANLKKSHATLSELVKIGSTSGIDQLTGLLVGIVTSLK